MKSNASIGRKLSNGQEEMQLFFIVGLVLQRKNGSENGSENGWYKKTPLIWRKLLYKATDSNIIKLKGVQIFFQSLVEDFWRPDLYNFLAGYKNK